MNRREIAIRTFAGALVSAAAAWAWWRLMGQVTTLTRILPSVALVAISFGFGAAGGRRVARGMGALLGLGVTFACGFLLGAMTVESSRGGVSPGAFIKGVIEGLGILLTSPVPAPVDAETVTATIIFSGYVTVIACQLACTRAPATALIPPFALFLGATALSQGSPESPIPSGILFAVCALVMMFLIPKSGSRGAITDGVEFAEAQTERSPGRYIYGATVAVFIAVISFLAFQLAHATAIGTTRPPYDPHQSSDYRPKTDINAVYQVQQWQTISRASQTPLFTAKGTNLTPALWWSTAESYNGRDWISRKTYENVVGSIPYKGAPVNMTRPVSVRVATAAAMPGPWLPNIHCTLSLAGTPIRANSECDLITRSDDAASTSFLQNSRTLAPRNMSQLTSAGNADWRLATTSSELPGNFPVLLKEFADQAVSADDPPYARLQSLSDALSTSDFNPATSSAADPFGYEAINDFVIDTKLGTQAQYATAFALMARYKGFSTRLATGFRLPTKSGGTVTNQQAIVWPEVKMTRAGWVPFAPGPQVFKSGVPIPQVFTPQPAPKPKPKPKPTPPKPKPPTPKPTDTASTIPTPLLVAGGALLAFVVWVLFVRVWRRRLRRKLDTDPPAGTFGPWTWMRSIRRHLRAPLPLSPGSTARNEPLVSEEARRRRLRARKDEAVQTSVPTAVEQPSAGLHELASIAEPALYGPDKTADESVAKAWQLSDADASAVLHAHGLRGRLRWWLVPLRRTKDEFGKPDSKPRTMSDRSAK